MNKIALINHPPPQNPDQLESLCHKYGKVTLFIFLGYGLLGVLLALITPSNILDYAWAQNIIKIPARAAPVFLDVPDSSPIPSVVKFYFGVMWLVMPVLYIYLAYEVYKCPAQCMSRPQIIKILKSKLNSVFFIICVLAFTIFGFYLATTSLYKPEDGVVTRALFSSRASLATTATVYNFALLFFADGIIWAFRSIRHSWKKLP